jgi:hypothetical protein
LNRWNWEWAQTDSQVGPNVCYGCEMIHSLGSLGWRFSRLSYALPIGAQVMRTGKGGRDA